MLQYSETLLAFPLKKLLRRITVSFLLLMITLSAQSQVKIFPIQKIIPKSKLPAANAKTKATLLDLPFYDDFSFTPVDDPSDTTSNFPLASLWQNSYSTWVTSATGVNLPTINAAVLDGLDSLGRPYSDQVLANGFRDKLQSLPIDLSAAKVVPSDGVWLSFAYQCGGNGEMPDDNDFLRLEFLDKDTTWVEVASIYPTESTSAQVFYDTMIQLNDSRFYHNNFQFRFRSFGRQSGPFDTWILDEVWLGKGRTPTVNRYADDIALASTFSPLFGRYYAIPLVSSLLRDEIFSAITFDVQNRQPVDETREATIQTKVSTYKDSVLIKAPEVDDTGTLELGAFSPFQRKNFEFATPLISGMIDTTTAADWIDIDVTTWLTATALGPEPILFRSNDTLTTRYRLHNYYAYDDGSAEFSLILTQPGNRLLYQFDIDTTAERRFAGFDIYIPPFGVTEQLRVDFIIYGHDEATNGPGEVLYTMASKPIARTGLNEFQRFTIPETEPDVAVKDKIYVGWVAPVATTFHVGLDRSNNTADKVFVRTSGEWQTVDSFEGSIMIRPLFGRGIRVPSGIEEELVNVPLYPNPSRGEFFIDARTEVTSILNLAGQSIPFDSEFFNDQHRITMSPTSPGIYLVKMKKGSSLFVRKLMLTR